MTKKDYVVLAAALKRARPDSKYNGLGEGLSPEWLAWSICVTEVSVSLKGDNPNFDALTFYTACVR